MKNSNTTIRELSRKYRSVLLKCALLNAMIITGAMPAVAGTTIIQTVEASGLTNTDYTFNTINFGTSSTLKDKNGNNKIIDFGTTGAHFIDFTMADNDTLLYSPGSYNNIYAEKATFAGNVNFQDTGRQHSISVQNATLNNVDFTGGYQVGNDNSWGNFSGFQSNKINVAGNVSLKYANIYMISEAMQGEDYFENIAQAEAFDLNEKYTSETSVFYNGNLYTTSSDNKSFYDKFYSNIKNSSSLEKVSVIEENAPLASMGTEYISGRVFTIINTKEALLDAGLIASTDYSEKDDTDPIILAFKVKENSTFKTLSPTDVLTEVGTPTNYETSVNVENANVKMDKSNLAGEIYLDEMQQRSMAVELTPLKTSLLTNNEEALKGVDYTYQNQTASMYNLISNIDVYQNKDGLWNLLDTYLNEENEGDKINENSSIYSILEAAFEKIDAIDVKYYNFGSQTENLPFNVNNSKIELIGGSRIGKETSGTVIIKNSTINVLEDVDNTGKTSLEEKDFSSIDHMGYSGDMFIQDESIINLYSNGALLRTTADDSDGWLSETVMSGSTGNIFVNNSTINMYGSTNTVNYTSLFDGESTSTIQGAVAGDGAIILVNNDEGTLQLTDNSTLNAIGNNNNIYLRNSGFSVDTNNWKNSVSSTALYVNNSTINIGDVNNSGAVLSVYHYDSTTKVGGKIALDDGATVNVYGTLNADIVSITPSVEISAGKVSGNLNILQNTGAVNLYTGSKINGTISGSNIYAKSKATQFGGTLTAQNSVFDIGTNKLKGETLSLKDTLLVSTIASDGSYGSLDLTNLSFVNSLIRINVDLDAVDESGKTIQFANAGLGLKSSDFYNTMYDMTYNNGQLTLRRNGNSGFISLKDLNEQMTASAWLKGGFSSSSPMMHIAQSLNTWMQTDPDKFARVIKQLKPTEGSQAQQTANSVNQQIAHAVGGRFGGSASGRSAGDTFKNVGAWAQGLYNKTKLDTTNGYTGKTKGISMGFDGILFDTTKLGFGYAYTTTDINADGSDTDVDTHTAILYAEHNMGNAFVNAIGTYGYSKYDATRPTDLGINVNSDYHMDSLYGQIMGGYHFDVAKKTTFTPEAGLRYLWTKAHDYEEKELDQKVSSGTTNTWSGVLGGRIETQIQTKKVTFVPEFKLAATYDLKNDKGVSTVALANGSSYRMEGKTLKRFGVETGLKLGMNVDNMEFSVNYEGRFKQDYTDHTGLLNFRYNF